VLFERAKMPRRKVCGGALSLRALNALGFPLPASLVDSEIRGVRLHLAGRTAEAREPERVGVLVTRASFDHYLLSRAEECGVQVVWKEVKAVTTRPQDVLLSTSEGDCIARCAIVCEGGAGRLSRLVREPDPPHLVGFGIEADVPAAGGQLALTGDGLLYFRFDTSAWGYGWLFDHGSYYSVGIWGLRSRLDSPLDAFWRFVRECGLAPGGVQPRGHYLPIGGIKRTLCANRILLAGDAAGFMDPLHGEGVAYAIRSGQLAAEAALAAAAKGDLSRSGLSRYESMCGEEFGRELRWARRFTQAMYWWPSLFGKIISADERVLRKYLLIPRRELSYSQFIRWLAPRAPWFCLRPGSRRRQ
jgi:flavin-dependent dehydrogenase